MIDVKKKSILFVVDEKKMGGVSILLEDMLKAIDLTNKQIDILVLHNSGNRFVDIPKNINIIYGTPFFRTVDLTIKEVLESRNLKLILNKIRLVLYLKTGLIKRKIIKERNKFLHKKYDIEIAFKDGFTAVFTAVGNSNKKIHWLQYNYKQGNPNKKYDRLFKEILPRFDNIVSVSKGVMDDFNEIYHLNEKTQVINNLVNVQRIKSKSLEKSNEILDKSKLNIISVGRLHYVKGYNRLIDAVNMLNHDCLLNNVIFRIYGSGPEEDKLRGMIKSYGLENIIKLMGEVDNPYKEIKNSDLFVTSSLFESFGLVIVESLILGVPVITTKLSASDELVDNGVTGLIVDNSTDGLYNGLKEIINSKDRIKKYKKNLINYNYNIKNKVIINKINTLLEEEDI